MGRVADIFILNVLCVLCCIPIITAGASLTATFYVAMKMVRNEESYIVKDFFKSFKQNLKQATVIHLILLVVLIVLGLDINIVRNLDGTLSDVLTMIFMAFGIIFVFIFLYVYPVLAKFYNTTKNTFVNALLLSIRHLPYTVIMIIISALPFAVLFIPNTQLMFGLLTVIILIAPACVVYSNSCFFVKIFDNYIPKEEYKEELPESESEAPESEEAAQ